MQRAAKDTQEEEDENTSNMSVVVCCSDHRIDPDKVLRAKHPQLGKFFTIRSAGHVLDAATLESIRFAVDCLHPRYVIVLGHYGCRALRHVTGALKKSNIHKCYETYPFMTERLLPICLAAIENAPGRVVDHKRLVHDHAMDTADEIIHHTGMDPERVKVLFCETPGKTC